MSNDITGVQFVIRTNQTYYNHFLKYIVRNGFDQNSHQWIKQYLGHHSAFEIDGQGRFGFGRCASVSVSGDVVELRVTLKGRQHNARVILTLCELLSALNRIRQENSVWVPTDREQILELSPMAENANKGHLIDGCLYPAGQKALELYQPESRQNSLQHVHYAMQTTWEKVAPHEYVQYSDSADVGWSPGFQPILTCFGFGICSGIRPQDMDAGSWRISSDNIDVAHQSLTILAGWFKLESELRQQLYIAENQTGGSQ
jgi:hypothetical protein